mmetsp:Transcript_25361/g.73116  ORF Transcript_25361/g.73116 Transcript_25361/m.73116 type:complete len:98 (+) Transcript_25361:98-391(+)
MAKILVLSGHDACSTAASSPTLSAATVSSPLWVMGQETMANQDEVPDMGYFALPDAEDTASDSDDVEALAFAIRRWVLRGARYCPAVRGPPRLLRGG